MGAENTSKMLDPICLPKSKSLGFSIKNFLDVRSPWQKPKAKEFPCGKTKAFPFLVTSAFCRSFWSEEKFSEE
jgi:hypothetical protein